jgi:TrmH family RNA methyltransferase
VIRTIAGRQNDSIKLALKLQKKKYRRERGLFLTEGMDLLVAGVEHGVLPVEVLVREDLVRRLPQSVWDAAQRDEIQVGVCAAELLQQTASLAGAVDVIAFFPAPSWSLGHLALAEGVSIYLYGVGDPGNMGTIVRSAVAFGAGGVMTSPGSADAYGPKALRAGMGAHFSLPVVEEVAPADLLAKLDSLARGGAAVPRLVVADPRGEVEVSVVAEAGNQPTVVVLGAERGELPDCGRPVERVIIPQKRFDSLNVAMAATILLYELSGAARARVASSQAPGS